MQPFLPPKAAPIAFGFLVSGFMTFIVSGIATFNAIGLADNMLGKWISAWGTSWIIAFPIILVVAPFVHFLIGKIVKKP